MFIGHLPAGYITTYAIVGRCSGVSLETYRSLFGAGLVASVLPDFDLFYFYLFDGRQHLHHTYWTHLPAFWLVLLAGSVILAGLLRNRLVWLFVAVIYANIFLHMLLDTLVGHILWLYPFSNQSFALFEVESKYGWWVWNFVLHWTFLLEIALWMGAVMLFWRRRRLSAALNSEPAVEKR